MSSIEHLLLRRAERRRELRHTVNGYLSQIEQFPGRIFTFNEPERERDELLKIVSAAKSAVVEIGSGSGGYLLDRASKHSDTVFIGCELRYKRAVRTIEKAIDRGMSNTYVLHFDGQLFDKLFQPQSIDELVVNFPDPWAKKKQLKHRMLTANFLAKASSVLRPGGIISVKTDHQEYFATFLAAVNLSSIFTVRKQTTDLYASPYLAENTQTEFERLFISQQKKICFLQLQLAEAAKVE